MNGRLNFSEQGLNRSFNPAEIGGDGFKEWLASETAAIKCLVTKVKEVGSFIFFQLHS
jgi:hypothetical protein